MKSSWLPRFLKRCWLFLAIFIIILGLLSSLFRALTPFVKDYKPQLESKASDLINKDIHIGILETDWYWFRPVLKLKDLQLIDLKGKKVELKTLLLSLDLMSSLFSWKVKPGLLYIKDLSLNLRQTKAGFELDGFDNATNSSIYKAFIAFLLSQEKIVAKEIKLAIYLKNHAPFTLKLIKFVSLRQKNIYHLKGLLSLGETQPTLVTFIAKLRFKASSLETSTGQIYLSTKNAKLASWSWIWQNLNPRLKAGQAQADLWLDLEEGRLKNLQTSLKLDELSWENQAAKALPFISKLQANLSWKKLAEGWSLSADKLHLSLDQESWPENQLQINYSAAKDRYQGYIKYLIVNRALQISPMWIDSLKSSSGPLADVKTLKKFLKAQPKLELNELQFEIKERKLTSFLAEIKTLSWEALAKIPGMNQLSGVFFWKNKEAQVILQGQKLRCSFSQQAPFILENLETYIKVKSQDAGFALNLEKLYLKHPLLTLNSQGSLEFFAPALKSSPTPFKDLSLGKIQLDTELSATQAEFWLKYLQEFPLNLKLYAWFKRAMKTLSKIKIISKINGLTKEFPFDRHPGDFTVEAKIQGLNLVFHPEWPLAKDIQAQLRINKRELTADIFQATIGGIALQPVHLQIPDLGHGHESLAFSTQLKTKTDKLFAFALESPLKIYLKSIIDRLRFAGDVLLNLKLKIPLYTPSGKISIDGKLSWEHNLLKLKSNPSQGIIPWSQAFTDGKINFSVEGITEALIQAQPEKGDPLRLEINQAGAKLWSILIEAKNIAAKLKFAQATHRLTGKFSRLYLTQTPSSSNTDDLKPQDFPNLAIEVKDLRFNQKELGELQLNTHSNASSLSLDAFNLLTPFYYFSAQGLWKEKQGKQSSEVKAKLELKHLEKTLVHWGFKPVVEALQASLSFKGQWPGGFHAFSLAKVSGDLSLSLQQGRINDLSKETEEKLGFGKLLSILSLQTLPRRLILDFSDLSHKGYSFDKFKANFSLAKGLLSTTDAYMEGPIAYANMKGQIDLIKQSYDLIISIAPHVTASLPLVATLAGGPIVGIATWTLNKILHHGIDKISQYTYKVTGPWKKPVVKQVSLIRG